MLTGHSTILSAVEAIKLVTFDYLTKPCDINELISKVKQAVSRKKEREAKIFDIRIKLYITNNPHSELYWSNCIVFYSKCIILIYLLIFFSIIMRRRDENIFYNRIR